MMINDDDSCHYTLLVYLFKTIELKLSLFAASGRRRLVCVED